MTKHEVKYCSTCNLWQTGDCIHPDNSGDSGSGVFRAAICHGKLWEERVARVDKGDPGGIIWGIGLIVFFVTIIWKFWSEFGVILIDFLGKMLSLG